MSLDEAVSVRYYCDSESFLWKYNLKNLVATYESEIKIIKIFMLTELIHEYVVVGEILHVPGW